MWIFMKLPIIGADFERDNYIICLGHFLVFMIVCKTSKNTEIKVV